MEIQETTVEANGLTFGLLTCGEGAERPLALCLHGFPDSAWTWRHLLPDLAAAGFRAAAPWLRGYAPSDVPADGAVGITTLAADADALHDALGGDERAVLIGHDWGAIAAYAAGARSPQRWHRLVTAAVPPPATAAAAFTSYAQLKRSFYVLLFQTDLAEAVVAADDLLFLDRLWQDWSPSYDATIDLGYVKSALRDPANLATAIGYYRAMLRGEGMSFDSPPQPTLYLHGTVDGAFGVEGVTGAADQLAAGSRVEVIGDVGHFLHLERPAEVNRLIVDWVTGER